MATGWVKSLQCKSKALDDVVQNHHHHHHHRSSSSKNNHRLNNIKSSAASCRKSVQSLKDVVETTTTTAAKQKPKKNHRPQPSTPPPALQPPTTRVRPGGSARLARGSDPIFPALSELPVGHPSRNVVEIIFHTSWTPKAFSGLIEMVFKVQNLARTVTRFEEYRQIVKSRAGSDGGGAAAAVEGSGCEDQGRCVADGNEVMRFHCLGPTNGAAYDAVGGGAWAFHGRKGAAICTFSGSGGAHESSGGGRGRRAMLVCRVIAGRVGKRLGFDSLLERRVGFDSVSGENGELLVFDARAVLPCFLIIYKL